MKKIILIDLDGVIIQSDRLFSEIYSEEYDVPSEKFIPFFKNEYGKAARGQVSIRDILPEYLEIWGWDGTVDEFLEYWFESELDLDSQVVDEIWRFKEKGYKFYLTSDNEKERADYLMKSLKLGDFIDGTYFSHELGLKKSEKDYFRKVLNDLGVEETEAIFIDDDPENVEVARSIGIESYVFENDSDLKDLIS